jgi:biotin synthase
MIGNYLTRMGRPPLEDIQMIKDMGHTLSNDPLTGKMPVENPANESTRESNSPTINPSTTFINFKHSDKTCDTIH